MRVMKLVLGSGDYNASIKAQVGYEIEEFEEA